MTDVKAPNRGNNIDYSAREAVTLGTAPNTASRYASQLNAALHNLRPCAHAIKTIAGSLVMYDRIATVRHQICQGLVCK
ncbi:jg6461 [Pararge aegeria aegeria]|uniref:Jg6461 protein n=1 Tax=Pararge aegeria aegeria TaxID=348720 RepID=A0A8S4RRY7_9NEOP|nr:jg6461 [Pararge aegeria aegeria]